jgi:hypothetical protein
MRKQVCALCLVLASALIAQAAITLTVSKISGQGQFTSIQAAVNAARRGDIVKVLDAGVYAEQVIIDSSKSGLTLTSANPLSLNKPSILWQDKLNVGPKTCLEAKDDKNVTFDRNSALMLLYARNVTIDGIKIDGGGAFPFGSKQVWDGNQPCQWSMQFGNCAIAMVVSGHIIVRNCDIGNAYIGINIKDRNQGGIFANANPADNQPWNVVPLSGFGKTGEHLIENNRIHNNSFGFHVESAWDLGSTIRYNLIYENHHTDAFALQVKALTEDGTNQPGGAFFFKDVMLSPLAIYNNTFWHNFLIFCGHWRAGSQHLIFNNIYAQPNHLWGEDKTFPNPFQTIDKVFTYRMKNCLYAAMAELSPRSQKISAQQYDQTLQKSIVVDSVVSFYQVRISNDLQNPQQSNLLVAITLPMSTGPVVVNQTLNNVTLPGALITTPFPAEANIRWLEPKFKSTDPLSPDFLTPDWDDPIMKKYVVDQGYPDAGVRDADGSIADLGAIPYGGKVADVALIRPLSPVIIAGDKATLTFDVSVESGTFNNPKIKYIRFIKNVPFGAAEKDAFGPATKPIPAANILEVAVPGTFTVQKGSNTLTVTTPARAATEVYAFYEIILEGTGSAGQPVTSTLGFMPYRKLDYSFAVVVQNLEGTKQLDTVPVGQPVKIKITALNASGSMYTNPVSPIDVRLQSSAILKTPAGAVFSVDTVLLSTTKPAVFTKVPSGNGLEYVIVSGMWVGPDSQQLAFFGISNGVTVQPGDPAKVVFEGPPSNNLGVTPPVINHGQLYNCQVQVFDIFDNKVTRAVQLSVSSSDPAKGDVDGSATITTGANGTGAFKAKVTNGKEDDIFTLIAKIDDTKKDQADLRVGKPVDQIWIFYNDAGAYLPTAEIRGQVGDRIKVTIWASKDGKTATATRSNLITMSALTAGLKFYASLTAAAPQDTFLLLAGKAELYISSITPVTNGSIEAGDKTDNSLYSGDNSRRANIFFIYTPATIDSAFYYSDNGFGVVNRCEIYYKKELPEVADSVALYWPGRASGERRALIKGDPGMTIAPDNKHVTIRLAVPFFAGVTGGDGSGTSYDKLNPDVPSDSSFFKIADRAGPILIDSAVVYQRFAPGNDTLVVLFSEKMTRSSILGTAFTLIKSGAAPVPLSLIGAAQTAGGETRIKFAAADLGAQAPAPGDSLQILSSGPVRDLNGNPATIGNRPVPIRLATRPVPVISAAYFDKNADGSVDALVVLFAKPILQLNAITLTAVWREGNVMVGTVDVSRATYVTAGDGTRAVFPVVGARIQTSGQMDINLQYQEFPGELTKSPVVFDSAAPVISAAVFFPGTIQSDRKRTSDTLVVTFSEDMADIASKQPFVFKSASAIVGQYSMTLTQLSKDRSLVGFIVDSLDSRVKYPRTGDSVWINTTGLVSALNGLVQLNQANRRVALEVKPMPYKIEIHAGPNPFDPARPVVINGKSYSGITFEIDPLTNLDDDGTGMGTVLDCALSLYDVMGNLIGSCSGPNDQRGNVRMEKDKLSSKVYFFWSGHNMNNRQVGCGSYLAVFKISDNRGNRVVCPPVLVGVARAKQ